MRTGKNTLSFHGKDCGVVFIMDPCYGYSERKEEEIK
jgi:hypothetical protein